MSFFPIHIYNIVDWFTYLYIYHLPYPCTLILVTDSDIQSSTLFTTFFLEFLISIILTATHRVYQTYSA